MKRKFSRASKWLVFPPVLVGAAVLAFFLRRGSALERAAVAEVSRKLRVIPVAEHALVPRVLGYGTAQPEKVWNAVAEVQGDVIEVHPELRTGALIEAGTTLLRIDDTEYKLALRQLRAERDKTKVELAELDVREQNLQAALTIDKRSVELAQGEANRIRGLVESNAASRASLDMTERELLRQQQAVQTQQNSLNLIPSQRAALNALLESQAVRIEDAELDVEKASLKAPFGCRLGQVNIDVGQFIAVGQNLFDADGTAATEVMAQIPVDRTKTLLDPSEYDMAELLTVLASRDPVRIRELFRIDVTVRASAGDYETSWDARFVTTSAEVDPRTRTVGFISVVDKPYEQIIPGERPPLVRGVFCEVELRGRPLSGRIVIPRLAVHDDSVYVVNRDSRLERRRVKVEFVQSDLAVISAGLEVGETLIVSDPTPAIDGQLVSTMTDDELAESIRAGAAGEQPLR